MCLTTLCITIPFISLPPGICLLTMKSHLHTNKKNKKNKGKKIMEKSHPKSCSVTQ